MFSGTKKIFAIGLVGLAFAGCKTTSGDMTNVDKTRGQVSLYSSGDKRSSLADPAKMEDVKSAEATLKKHLRKDRSDVDSILALAQVQVAEGDYDAAEKNCFTALRLDLKNKDARKVLAQIAIRRGNYDLASIFLANVAGGVNGDQTKDSSVLNMMAMIELARGNNTGAMEMLKRAIHVNGNDMAARMNMGVLMLKYRQLAQAATEFERVLKVMPNHSDAKLHLAIIKASRGQAEEATTMLKEVLSSDEKNPLALYNLAVMQRNADQYGDAMDNLKEYLKSTRGKPTDNDQVFALIEDIQKIQAEKGQKVSDDEIQAMAQQMTKKQQDQDAAPQAKQVAKADGQPEAKPAKKAAPAAKAAPAKQQALEIPDSDEGSSASEEIDDLEKALAH